MTYPKEFSHKQKEHKDVNTHIPSLHVDFPRLFNNDPKYYISMGSSRVLKPNKLILADWTAANWDAAKIAQVKKCILELTHPKVGHEVYIWQSGVLKKITTQNLDELDSLAVRQGMTPEEPGKITVSALKKYKHFTKDNAFILDDYWLERALHPAIDSIKRQVRISDLVNSSEENRQKILTLLKKSKPRLEEIILDECSNEAAKLLGLLNASFPNCKIKPQIQTIIFPLEEGNPHVSTMMNILCTNASLYFMDTRKLILRREVKLTQEQEHVLKQCLSIRELRIEHAYPEAVISTLNLENLEILDLEQSDVNSEQIVSLLKKSNNIIKVAVNYSRVLTGGFYELPQALTKLATLELKNSKLTLAELITLLAQTPNIESIDLSGCKNLKKDFSELSQPLTQLKRIDLSNSNITMTQLSTLLAQTPNIENIMLGGCRSLWGDFLELAQPLKQLKTIDLSNAEITMERLNALLAQAPNIENINLGDTYGITWDISKLPTLTKLKTIDLSKSRLTLEQLSSLLALTPNIESINLYSWADFTGKLIELPQSFELPEGLTKLKSINLKRSHITMEQLSSLLGHAPNIEIIALDSCAELTGHFSELPQALTKLKSISLTYSNITLEQLSHLLTQAPNIESIDLSSCGNLTDHFPELPQDLTKLKTINLSGTKINLEQLSPLLAQTPNLESIELWGSKSLPDHIFQIPQALIQLKSINLSHSEITLEQLSSLFERTPNIECIDLESADLKGLFSKLPDALTRLKRVDLSNSNITIEQLGTLLEQIPNIESLNLEKCKNLTGDFSKLLGTLVKLKTINLSESNITSEQLSTLLEQTPNLEDINLKGCRNLTGDFSKLSGTLAKLKTINLSESNITSEQLSTLLEQTPNLEDINLKGCRNLTGDFSKLSGTLAKLKTINLANSNITLEQLSILLEQAPNLESINLNFCENLTGHFSNLPKTLTKLKKISLACNKIITEQLKVLLQTTPYLEELHVQGDIENCSEELANLSRLKSLDIASSNISLETLTILLNNNPNLEVLDISYCKQLNGDFPEPLPNLFHLKTLETRSSNISLRNIAQLLKKTPSIEVIEYGYSLIEFIQSLDPGIQLPNLKKITNVYLNDDEIQYFNKNKGLLNKLHRIAPNLDLSKIEEKIKTSVSSSTKNQLPEKTPFLGGVSSPQLPGINRSPQLDLSSPKTEDQEQSLDADTELDPHAEHNLNRIFYYLDGSPHPEITEYRREAFGSVHLNETPGLPDKAFTLFNEADAQFTDCDPAERLEDVAAYGRGLEKTADHNLVYAKHQLYLTNSWQALPSVSAAEELLCFHTDPADAHIEWQYSKRDNLYYIKSDSPQYLQLDFLLKVPKNQPKVPKEIKKKLQSILDFFLPPDFGPKALEMTPGDHTGQEYLDALKEQKTGACRHRTVIFKDLMTKHLPDIPVRIIQNECHAFAEIQIGGQWRICNLGGYPSKLNIIEQAPGEGLKLASQQLTSSGTAEAPKPAPSPQVQPPPARKKEESPRFEENPYLKVMETWLRTEVSEITTPLAYQQELVQPNELVKKTLIELGSEEAVQAMAIGLQKYCHSINRPVYYIHSPADIVCQSDFIQRKGNKGILTRGPGGPLYDFLHGSYSKDNPPILIINYANFSPEEIIGLHGLLDPKRVLGGEPVPPKAQIFGLANLNAESIYEGSDFYSRFDVRDYRFLKHPDVPEFLKHPPLPPEREEGEEEEVYTINLFHAADWESQLLGRWVIDAKGFRFEEGLLKEALASKKTIHIQNGLWEDPDFRFFWQQAQVLGHIKEFGETFDTQNLQLCCSEGYDWALLKAQIEWKEHPQAKSHLLNPSQLGEFLGGYRFNAKKKNILPYEGLIEEARKKGQHTLKVTLTRSITEDEWARMLSQCAPDITLEVALAPGVCLPECLDGPQVEEPYLEPWALSSDATQIIQSTDPDTTIALITEEDLESWEIIDVSECSSSDLLLLTQPHYNKKKLSLTFTQTERAVLTALKAGKKVVLTGRIPEELADALNPLLLERQKAPSKVKGSLVIVSQDTSALSVAYGIHSHEVTLEEKASFLDSIEPTEEPLSLLQARERFPGGDQGLLHLERTEELEPWDPDTSEGVNEAFHAERNQGIQDSLFHPEHPSPCVFLAGLSGVGKTTFVNEELMKGKPHKVYHDAPDMSKWAMDKSPHPKFLFIDEANLSPRQWSEMEGLYHNKPPKILIDGVLHTLDENHKVIFAGNPISYGDERQLAPFFERHPCALVFKPLPLAVVYEQILKPVFEGTDLEAQSQELCKPLFAIYAYLCAQSTTEILISPRELQMISLLTLSYCREMPDADPQEVAAHYAYQLSQNLVPEQNQADFDSQFKPEQQEPFEPLPLPDSLYTLPHFQVTPSRMPVLNTLNELLVLHEARTKLQHKAQRQGGLGGIILEGDSSVGKSALALALLGAHGYKPVHGIKIPKKVTKPVLCIDASMTLAQKNAVLDLATKLHAPLLIDEFNSAPLMERKLNNFLMQGNLLIAIQNPASLSGRRAPSTALARRMMKVEVPSYTEDELLKILLGKRKEEDYPNAVLDEFKRLIEAYLIKSKEAAEKGYTPAPTLRELLRQAKYIRRREGLDLLEEADEVEEVEDEVRQQHPCSYFVFRVLEATALIGGLALLAAAIAASLGAVAIIAGAALAVAGAGALIYRFFKECSENVPAEEGSDLSPPGVKT